MKVRDLIEELKRYPQDLEIVTASDEEGNGFNLAYDVGVGWYDSSERDFTTEILEIDDDDDNELYRDRTLDECNALCIWP